MMKDGLHNKALGPLPAPAIAPFLGHLKLGLSYHAQRAARSDRYGAIDLQDGDTVIVEAQDVVEVLVAQERPVKAVVRLFYTEKLDLVLVVNRPAGGVAEVRTVWINRADDQHKTLDRSKLL